MGKAFSLVPAQQHRLMVVESSNNGLFLKRNFALRRPIPLLIPESPRRTDPHTAWRAGVRWRKTALTCSALADAEINQLPQTAIEPITNFPQRIGTRQSLLPNRISTFKEMRGIGQGAKKSFEDTISGKS